MKRIISVLILVCLMASMFTLSAWADGDDPEFTVGAYIEQLETFGTEDYRERFHFNIKVNKEVDPFTIIVLDKDEKLICQSTKTSPLAQGTTTANIVLYGEPSGSWYTIIGDTQLTPYKVEFWSNGKLLYEAYPTWTEEQKNTYSDFERDPAVVVKDSDGNVIATSFSLEYMAKAALKITAIDTIELKKANTELEKPETYTLTDANTYGNITIRSNSGAVLNLTGDASAFKNLKFDGDGLTVYLNGKLIYPVPVSSVPATADNSNMPLWAVLFISFAAVALLTGKKRRA